jgi:hypothetical protein
MARYLVAALLALVLAACGGVWFYVQARLGESEYEGSEHRSSGSLGSVSSDTTSLAIPHFFRDGTRAGLLVHARWPENPQGTTVLVLIRLPIQPTNNASTPNGGVGNKDLAYYAEHFWKGAGGKDVEFYVELVPQAKQLAFRIGEQAVDLAKGRVVLVDLSADPPNIIFVNTAPEFAVGGENTNSAKLLKAKAKKLSAAHPSVHEFWHRKLGRP